MRKWLFNVIIFVVVLAIAIAPQVQAQDRSSIELPVGDGRFSNQPRKGYVFVCNSNFRIGGARHVGEWFHGDTWSPAEKPHVQGKVQWPNALFVATAQRNNKVAVKSNGLPVGTPTGTFPIASNDPVYKYDTNPNPIKPQNLAFNIPLKPVKAEKPSCLSKMMIGFTTNGVAFYSALDDAGNDAAAHEVQDLCDGHPQGKGQYHYHSASDCLPKGKNTVVGWALDGYPILNKQDASGKLLTNADLDVCHGRAESVSVDGRTYNYAYRLTREYPYTLSCFSGQVLPETQQAIRASMGPPRQRGANGRPIRNQ